MPWVAIEDTDDAVPDYRQAFQGGNALTDYANSGAFQLDKLQRGGQNLYAKATGNEGRQAELAAEQQQRDAYLAPIAERSPIASFAGRAAPGLATAAVPGGLLAQVGMGAGLGGLEFDENQGANAAFGGALSGAGYGLGGLLSKAGNVVRATAKRQPAGGASGVNADMVKKADKLGMKLLPGDIADSRQLRQIDVGIKRNPATSSLIEEGVEQNQRILNKTAIEAMGETGDEVSENMLAKAARRIGDQYDGLLSDVDEIALDTDTLQLALDEMAQDSLPYIERYIKRFPSLQRGFISGKEAGRLRNLIQKDSKLVSKNFKADPDDLNRFQNLILEAAEDASGSNKDVLKTAGQQWRIMKTLERGNTVTRGNVNPKSLRSGLAQRDTRFKRGLLEDQKIPEDLERLYDAAKVSNHFTDIVGDSGTPTALQAADFLDPKTFLQRQLLRRGAKRYLESGSVPASIGILEGLQQPASPIPGQLGAGLLRGTFGANQ